MICDKDSMRVVFERSNLPKSANIDALYLRDDRCRASYNQTHVFVKTSLKDCGTSYHESDQEMFFSNTLYQRSIRSGGAVITRDHTINFNFTCSYGRKLTVGSLSFLPAKQTLTVSQSRYFSCFEKVVTCNYISCKN